MNILKKALFKLLCSAFVLLLLLTGCGKGEITDESSSVETTAVTESETNGVKSPVDFKELKALNKDIIGYITVPDTDIAYPVLYSGVDDNYYLRRNYLKKFDMQGSIYAQSGNSADFSDPVTVLYGHNNSEKTMFSRLLDFQNEKYFDEHEYFYIYAPGHILVYYIFSAHTYDERHILNSYDFSSAATLKEFQQSLLNPSFMEKNVRSGVSLDENSKIVVLSTCAYASQTSNTRYLVNGVLVDDVPTIQ